jgi:hypothetical protein
MGTHAVLGIKHADGGITGCYVHYDGDSMAPRIDAYVRENTTTGLALLITQAQAAGGIRSFHAPPFDPIMCHEDYDLTETELLDNDELYVIDESNFYDDHMGTFAWYLVDYETGAVQKKNWDE